MREWSEWSLCQLTCVNGEDLGFGGIQVRSRAVIIQELENQHLCPEQALETRPCNGKHQNTHKTITLPVRKKKNTELQQVCFLSAEVIKIRKTWEIMGTEKCTQFFCFPNRKTYVNYHVSTLTTVIFDPFLIMKYLCIVWGEKK